MAKAKYATQRTGAGTACVTFDEPTDPVKVDVLWHLPFGAKVTSVVVRYVTIPRQQAMDEFNEAIVDQRRHDAAVKANATRKARKAEKKEAPKP